jgi:hypothetical protein
MFPGMDFCLACTKRRGEPGANVYRLTARLGDVQITVISDQF